MVGIFENPYLHKIIGHFNSEIHATLSFEKTSTYLFNRHGLSDSKLAHTNVQAKVDPKLHYAPAVTHELRHRHTYSHVRRHKQSHNAFPT